jgi:hypothetical protein
VRVSCNVNQIDFKIRYLKHEDNLATQEIFECNNK